MCDHLDANIPNEVYRLMDKRCMIVLREVTQEKVEDLVMRMKNGGCIVESVSDLGPKIDRSRYVIGQCHKMKE